MSLWTCRTCGGLYAHGQYTCPKCGCVLDFAHVVDATQEQSDESLIDQIQAIRAQNNTHWMNIVRLSLELAPERTKELLRKIEQCDGEVRKLTKELADL